MKSNRTKATDISSKVRKEIHERDKHCIFCYTTSNPTVAHYISRAHGGLGCKENLALVCLRCHMLLDQSKHRQTMMEYFKKYLEDKYPGFKDEERKYRKWKN